MGTIKTKKCHKNEPLICASTCFFNKLPTMPQLGQEF